MCGAFAGAYTGSAGKTLILDHAKRPGEKSAFRGGRCNFTNIHTSAEAFISQNSHFAKSALARYSPWDFVDLVGRHGLTYHEKTFWASYSAIKNQGPSLICWSKNWGQQNCG